MATSIVTNSVIFLRGDANGEEDRQHKCIEAFRYHLNFLNKEAEQVAADICAAGINAAIGHVSYERISPAGPRRRELTESYPLLTTYVLLFIIHICFCIFTQSNFYIYIFFEKFEKARMPFS